MIEGLAICARDLVLAVFRLAVADYLGVAYGHDAPGPCKRTGIDHKVQAKAGDFLLSPWASHLADLAGFSAQTVWKEAQERRLQEDDVSHATPSPMSRVRRSQGRIDAGHGESAWLFSQPDRAAA